MMEKIDSIIANQKRNELQLAKLFINKQADFQFREQFQC